ncbi:MAG: addiction module protein [Planctomycetaceae bacterium]|nr:addiction module protein [Planctomycetaceae bacterium]
MTTESLTAAALALPPKSRLTLAEVLLRSVKPEADIALSPEWIAEIEDRIAAYRRGELETFSREEVMRNVGKDRSA